MTALPASRPGHSPSSRLTDRLGDVAVAPWMAQARCREVDPELFFPSTNGYHKARTICATCPVTAECLAWALDSERNTHWARFGMYGGLTPDERAARAKGAA